jgi:hypothetical protein
MQNNQLVQALRERYRYIFLATSGSGWSVDDPDIDQLALRMADRILVLVRPDVEGITLARRALQDRPRQQQVHVLLNQVGVPDQVSRRDVEAKLLAPVVAELPFDPWKVAEARARNRPVVCQRGCRLGPPLINLAGRILRRAGRHGTVWRSRGRFVAALPVEPVRGSSHPWEGCFSCPLRLRRARPSTAVRSSARGAQHGGPDGGPHPGSARAR